MNSILTLAVALLLVLDLTTGFQINSKWIGFGRSRSTTAFRSFSLQDAIVSPFDSTKQVKSEHSLHMPYNLKATHIAYYLGVRMEEHQANLCYKKS
jgi:hypothetical protein